MSKRRGNIKKSSVNKTLTYAQTIRVKILPRPSSDSDSVSDDSPRKGRPLIPQYVWISEPHSVVFKMDVLTPIKTGFAGIVIGFAMVESLRVFAPRSSGRAVKNASLFDSRRGNIFRT